MTTFSQWQPDGSYRYYDAPGHMAPLGDDMPSVHAVEVNGIGFPSSEYGQKLPTGARYAGTGPEAKGIVVPMDHSRLSGVPSFTASPVFWMLLGGGIVAGCVWWRRE